MYEVDFLPVESATGKGSKSGDAIAIRFNIEEEDRHATVIIDSGYSSVGDDVVNHLDDYHTVKHADLMISTHPDADHLNGLAIALEQLEVDELMIHQPRLHRDSLTDFSNLEALDNLLAIATDKGVKITEPFTGEERFGGRLLVLGPTEDYYAQLLEEQFAEASKSAFDILVPGVLERAAQTVGYMLDKTLSLLPVETLTDEGKTSARNNSSVVTLLQIEGRRLLFTGDAGMPALEQAADYYEANIGSFSEAPLRFIQVPHHGSRRNVGPTILDRVLGETGNPWSDGVTAFISSAKASTKHPSPKVVNAFSRRGCKVAATEGQTIRHHFNGPPRDGWSALVPFPPLVEDQDE